MESTFRAIAPERRRLILELVRNRELTPGQIASRFDVTRPAISQHLSILLDAGLVSERRRGRQRLYTARPEGLADVRAFVERFWDDRLERLRLEAEHHERSTDVDNRS